MPDYGIDVSGYNTVTSWPAVRGVGNSWMWAKATQGGGYTNPQFGTQINGARAAGLLVGAYHFPDPNVSVAVNVGHFRSVAASQHTLDAGCFVPLLDMEDDAADGIVWTAASANAFVTAFRDEFRRQAGVHELCVYGSESWFATKKLDPAQWVDDGVVLCVAQYSGVPGKVDWTHPRAAVHQYTSSAPTPGATKVTDRSATLGSWTAKQLTIGSGVSPAAKTNPGDIVFQFVCNGDTFSKAPAPGGVPDPAADNPNVLLLLGGGYAEQVTWADVRAKDRAYGGDGTGTVLGKAAADYQKYVDLDAAVRARDAHLMQLTAVGTPATPVTYDIATEPGGVVIAKAIPEKS